MLLGVPFSMTPLHLSLDPSSVTTLPFEGPVLQFWQQGQWERVGIYCLLFQITAHTICFCCTESMISIDKKINPCSWMLNFF